MAPGVQHIFQPGLFAVGAVAVFDEDPHDGGGDGDALVGRQQNAAIAGEILVAGDAAELHAEVDARRDRRVPIRPSSCPAATRTATKPMSLVSSSVLMRAAAVKGDVEFARQAVHLAVVEDVVVHLPGQRAGVDQFLRIDAGGGAGGDVADVVGPRAAMDDAQVVQAGQQIDGVFGADLAELEIGAGGDIGAAAAELLGQVGHAAQLVAVDDARREIAAGT